MSNTGQPTPTQLNPPTSLWELTVRYNAIHASLDAMGKQLLKLMRHPEATAEQIDEGRLKYFLVYRRWIEARMILREKYPPIKWIPKMLQKELPWNEKED